MLQDTTLLYSVTNKHLLLTYPSHMLIMLVQFAKQLPIEGPGERNVQSRVTGDLAGQDDALPDNDLHVHWTLGDLCGICPKSGSALLSETVMKLNEGKQNILSIDFSNTHFISFADLSS